MSAKFPGGEQGHFWPAVYIICIRFVKGYKKTNKRPPTFLFPSTSTSCSVDFDWWKVYSDWDRGSDVSYHRYMLQIVTEFCLLHLTPNNAGCKYFVLSSKVHAENLSRRYICVCIATTVDFSIQVRMNQWKSV